MKDVGADESPNLPNLLGRVLNDGVHRLLMRGFDRGDVEVTAEIKSTHSALRRRARGSARHVCSLKRAGLNAFPMSAVLGSVRSRALPKCSSGFHMRHLNQAVRRSFVSVRPRSLLLPAGQTLRGRCPSLHPCKSQAAYRTPHGRRELAHPRGADAVRPRSICQSASTGLARLTHGRRATRMAFRSHRPIEVPGKCSLGQR